MTCPDDNVVTQQAHLRIAAYQALGNHTTGHIAHTRNTEDLAHLDHADDLLAFFWGQHTRKGSLNIIDGIINYIVIADFDAILLGLTAGSLLGPYVKADHHSVRGNS